MTPAARRARAHPGAEALAVKGWWRAQRWLLLRRISQLGILALFLCGPLLGGWIVSGNLSSSLTLGVLPLTDPYLLLQTLAAGHLPYQTAWIGAALVAGFYLLLGGRVFCAWVCPVNLVTDAAAWLRRTLGIRTGRTPDAATRYWLLAGTLAAAAVSGSAVWEWVNPVSVFHRSLIFGLAGGLWLILGIFLYDLLIARHGWCGHLCPMGAFYSLLGRFALLRVTASGRNACDDCMDCFAICPEPQVIRPALKPTGPASPIVTSVNCTACGRCIDVCSKNVFKITHRFDPRSPS
ncbi:MAG: quinol dehydrogenase ferredoxin subunit NapH [Rhodocyclaceae bacterium]|nr:quinol dehydrogenase ferredoxin subunit NapH [Rhodocyclaceae bacterium]